MNDILNEQFNEHGECHVTIGELASLTQQEIAKEDQEPSEVSDNDINEYMKKDMDKSENEEKEEEEEYGADIDDDNATNNAGHGRESDNSNNISAGRNFSDFFDLVENNNPPRSVETLDCDYLKKMITIRTENGEEWTFTEKEGVISKTDLNQKDKKTDYEKIEVYFNNNVCAITITKKNEQDTLRFVINKHEDEEMFKKLSCFRGNEKNSYSIKEFVNYYRKHCSELKPAVLPKTNYGFCIKCKSGPEHLKYPRFRYKKAEDKIYFCTGKDEKRIITKNKVFANVKHKRVIFHIINSLGKDEYYKLPISDEFIEQLKQTNKDFNDGKDEYIPIDFKALYGALVMKEKDIANNNNDIEITKVEDITDNHYIFKTNRENTYIVYDGTDNTFNYVNDGENVGTYKIASYHDTGTNKDKIGHLNLISEKNDASDSEENDALDLSFPIRNKDIQDIFHKLYGKQQEGPIIINKTDLINVLKDKFKEKKNLFPDIIPDFLKKSKKIKYFTGEKITITSKDKNLIFSLDEKDENQITVPINDFLFGNLTNFDGLHKTQQYSVAYYDDALVLEHKTDHNRSPIIIDFKPILKQQGLDAEQRPELDDIKSFLIRIKAAEKQQNQGQGQFNENNDDRFLDAEDDIISAIYNNGKNITTAAAYMELNDYINEYAGQEMNQHEIDAFIQIID